MPYIKQEDRKQIDELVDLAVTPFGIGFQLKGAGEINYVVTKLIAGYLDKAGLSYATLNEIVGALDSAKAEFQRRVVGPYEDRKIEENGDVY